MKPRTSITYRLPGGLRATYSGEPMSYWRWLLATWMGGLALWRIWLRAAAFMVRNGDWPRPRDVSCFTARALRVHIRQATCRRAVPIINNPTPGVSP